MLLPFTTITSFILSYFGLFAITLLTYHSVTMGIDLIKKMTHNA